jgi:RNA polymerase sigma factor for flagellar operon FliA
VANKETVNVEALQQREKRASAKKAPISEQTVREHMPMVESIAASVAAGGNLPPSGSFCDLISWGLEGLVKAWTSFDKGKGVLFRTYSSYRVRGEILDRIRNEWRYRNPASYSEQQEKIQRRISEVARDALESDAAEPGADADADNPDKSKELSSSETYKSSSSRVGDLIANSAVVYLLSLDNLDSGVDVSGVKDPGDEIVEELEFARERTLLWEEIQGLNKLEKQLIHLFYIEDYNQKEIAERLNLSKSKVSRLHVKILEKLRRRLSRRM